MLTLAHCSMRCRARRDFIVVSDSQYQFNADSRPLYGVDRRIEAGGLCWYVQQVGQGPALLLIHGTGSSAHSWHRLAPLLAARWSLTAFDLPGHGQTRGLPEQGLSLPGMSEAIDALLRTLQINPLLVLGHSAGAAIAARMALDRRIAPQALLSLNGALLPLGLSHGMVFAPLAKILATLPFTSELFSWGARDRAAVVRLIHSTGSQLDDDAIDHYWRLLRRPDHVAGVLKMMSQWDLTWLQRQLPQLPVPLIQLVGSNDRTVPPSNAQRVRASVPRGSIVSLPGLGHLAHEESPALVAAAIGSAVDTLRV
jgi:magnesium chelatase accessory protein